MTKALKEKLERLANENYEKSRRLGEGSKAQVMYTSYAFGIRHADKPRSLRTEKEP